MENTMTAADIQAQVAKIEDSAENAIPENETQEEFIARVSYVNPYVKKLFEGGIKAKTAAQFHDELEIFCNDNECDLSEHTDFKRHLPVVPSNPPRPYTVTEAAMAHRETKDASRVALSCIKVEDGMVVATDGRRLFVAPYTELPDGLWNEVDKRYGFFFDGKTEEDVRAWIDGLLTNANYRSKTEALAVSSVYRIATDEDGNEIKSHYPRLIDGKWYHNYVTAEMYPDYKKVIPDDLSNAHKIENAERMLPYIESALKMYKMLPTDAVAVTVIVQGQMMYFNGMYLRDALRGLAGYGPVTMYIDGPSKPAKPTTIKSGDALVVLMPMNGDEGDDYRTKPSGVIVNMPGWDKPSNMPPSPTKRNTITKTSKRVVYAVASMITESTLLVVTQDGAAGFVLPINIEQTEDESIEMFKDECHKYLVILGLADSIDLRITKGR